MLASVCTNVSSDVPEFEPNTFEKSLSSVARSLLSDVLVESVELEELVEAVVSVDVSLDELSLDVDVPLSELDDVAPMAWASALSAPPRSP